MAQLPLQMKLKSPAKDVFRIYRSECHLFQTIMPEKFKQVKLVGGEWNSMGSERLWIFANANCGSWKDVVGPIDDGMKSITFTLLEGEVPKELYNNLKVEYQFTPHDHGCMAKAVLTFEKKSANGPDPHDYIEFIGKMFEAVDEYLQKH